MNTSADKPLAPNTTLPSRITLIDCIKLDVERRRQASQAENEDSGERRAENGSRRASIDRLQQIMDDVEEFLRDLPFDEDDQDD